MSENRVILAHADDFPNGIESVSFDWITGLLAEYVDEATPGYTYFVNEDGLAFDVAHTESWETIVNSVATDDDLWRLVIVYGDDGPTEADQRAADRARFEWELQDDNRGHALNLAG